MSRTRKLLTQIAQVCQEICDMKSYSASKKSPDQLDTCHKNRGHLPNKYEKGEGDCTCSTDNKKHVRCGDLQSNLHNQRRHASPVPLVPLPPSSPSLTSSHSSSEASASESSASSDEPSSCLTGDTFGEMMELSSSQKETKESLEEQDLRGGGLTLSWIW